MSTRDIRTAAFTLIELLLVVAIIALLISILLPALGMARKSARQGVCQSNLKQLGVAMHTYGADFRDQLFTYSWRKGQSLSAFGDLNGAGSDDVAACNQMADIVRRQGERTAAETPSAPALFPYLRYSHLVLQDYLGQRIPDPTVACPEDPEQKRWGLDPRGYDQGAYQPNYGTGPGSGHWRWPYRSNYWITIAAFDRNAAGSRARMTSYNSLALPSGPGVRFGNRTLSEVAFPGSKVFMYEQYGRHSNQVFDFRTFFGFDTARCVVQLFDNSVSLRNCKDANRGNSNPNIPNSAASTVPYNADGSTPDPAAPNGSIPAFVRFQSTRGGLKGIDFGGREIITTGY